MESFLILIVSIVVGVLFSRFLATRGTGKLKRRISGVVVGFIALVVLVGALNPPTSAPPKAEAAKADATAPVASAEASSAPQVDIYRTTVEALNRDYAANEVATDDKLKGKVVEIDDAVKSIDKDFTGAVVLRFATDNQFMDASMTLKDSEAAKAANLSKGEPVTLRCDTMQRIMGVPAGADCVLVN